MDRANSQATNIGFTGLRRWIYIFCAFWSLPTDLEEKKNPPIDRNQRRPDWTGPGRVRPGGYGQAGSDPPSQDESEEARNF